MPKPERNRQSLPHELETRERLGEAMFRYMVGQPADYLQEIAEANGQDLQAFRLLPRVLQGNTSIDISTTFAGQHWAAPFGVGAFAGDRLFHPEGLLPIARVCQRLRLPLIISEETVSTLEAIGDEHDGCWLQLRAAGDVARIEQLTTRAAQAGFKGLVLTVLAPVHPVAGLQPGGFSIGEALRNAGMQSIGSQQAGVEALPAFPVWTWQEIRQMVAHCQSLGLPLLLKGILHPDDAASAMASGVSGIIASNIGLRQSARWATPVQQMPALRNHTGGALWLDGGIRSGSDIVVACCLGADLALAVRPVISALVAGGEAAVEALLGGWINEISAISHWCGVSRIDELGHHLLTEASPL